MLRVSYNSASFDLCSFHHNAVPGGPPQNIILMDTDPAMLSVTYSSPLLQLHNGDLTGYIIRYTRVDTDESEMIMVNGDLATTKVVISRLVPFVNYSVEVAAININGTGPFSVTVIGLSGQDG